MATLAREARPSNEWSPRDLSAYNIEILDKDATSFFGSAELPKPKVSPVILNYIKEPQDMEPTKEEMDFFAYMEDAIYSDPDHNSLVPDFVVFLLRMLEYDNGRRVIHQQREMSFVMCGKVVKGSVDVCVAERFGPRNFPLLLVQENEDNLGGDPAEPQLIGAAIAALSHINAVRSMVGRPPLESRTFPGITMVGSMPVFYKIPVTRDLVYAVMGAQYPSQTTVVEKLIPRVPGGFRRGMVPLDNRRVIFQHLEAFKQFLDISS